MKKINALIVTSILTFAAISHAGLVEQMVERATPKYTDKKIHSDCKEDSRFVQLKFSEKFKNYALSDVVIYARGFNGLAKSTNDLALKNLSKTFLSAQTFKISNVERMIQASPRFCAAMSVLIDAREEVVNSYR